MSEREEALKQLIEHLLEALTADAELLEDLSTLPDMGGVAVNAEIIRAVVRVTRANLAEVAS